MVKNTAAIGRNRKPEAGRAEAEEGELQVVETLKSQSPLSMTHFRQARQHLLHFSK